MNLPGPFTTFARLEDDVNLTEMRAVTVPEWDAMQAELTTLRARAAYILSHGDAFSQAVVRGEKDHALGVSP